MMPPHRKPPLPPWFYDVPRGTCRLCGQPVTEPRRIYWHSECLREFLIIIHQRHQAVLEASGHRCGICGKPLEEWEDDHIIPLVDALPHADDPLWAWRLGNRQALCPDCHRAKTAREAARRARWRRRTLQREILFVRSVT